MRASGAVLFFLGLMMVYVGLFGLTVPTGFQWTTGFVDEFDDDVIGSQWTTFIWDADGLGGIEVEEYGGAVNIYVPYQRQAGGLETVHSYLLGDGAVVDSQIRSLGVPPLASGVLAFGPIDHENKVYRMIYTSGNTLIVRKMFSPESGDREDLYTGTYSVMNPRVAISGSTIAFFNGLTALTSETYAWSSWACKFWFWIGASSVAVDSSGRWERFELDLGGSPPPTYTLTADVVPSAGGTVTRNPDQPSYEEGTQVSCMFYPNTDYIFDYWELGGVNVGSANPYVVTMTQNYLLVANCHYVGNGQEYAELMVQCREDLDGDNSWNAVSNLKVDVLQGTTLIASIYTDNNGFASKTNLDVGTYTVTSTYSGKTDSETVSLSVGSNPTVNLYFSEALPPQDDFLEWLKALLEDPTFRTLSLLGGFAFCGIGIIVMMTGHKEEQIIRFPQWL